MLFTGGIDFGIFLAEQGGMSKIFSWLRRTPPTGLPIRKTLYYGPHSKWKTIFLGRNSKSRSSAFRNFFIYQNFKGFVWVINLFLSWGMFFIKKVYFLAKTAVRSWKTYQALLSPELQCQFSQRRPNFL